eukprot:gene9463-10453_t
MQVMVHMGKYSLLSLLLFFLLLCVYGKNGVDLSIAQSKAAWQTTFPKAASQKNFVIVQGTFYNNTVNTAGLAGLPYAWKAGVLDLSVYLFPCFAASTFITEGNATTCPTAAEQVDQLLDAMSYYYLYFLNTSQYADSVVSEMLQDPYSFPTVYNASSARHVLVSRLFINVEDSAPNYYFALNHSLNVQFLSEMVSYCHSKGIATGIYTTRLDWTSVMMEDDGSYRLPGGSTTWTNPFAMLPLWTPRYDSLTTMSFYRTFGNWSSVAIKQLSGGSKEMRRTGSSRICVDYIATNSSSA